MSTFIADTHIQMWQFWPTHLSLYCMLVLICLYELLCQNKTHQQLASRILSTWFSYYELKFSKLYHYSKLACTEDIRYERDSFNFISTSLVTKSGTHHLHASLIIHNTYLNLHLISFVNTHTNCRLTCRAQQLVK